MNEWDIQKRLTKYWRKHDLIFKESVYSLICWELMFPSWSINDNRRKWNEPSIDFVFYDEEKEEFLIVELKNEIKDTRSLLSVYCQVQHRSLKFIEGYSIDKISKARKECFDFATDERGGGENDIEKINFSKDPKIAIIVMAVYFPMNATTQVENWNNTPFKGVLLETDKYQKSKEFERLKLLKEEDLQLLDSNRVKLIPIHPFLINDLTSIITMRIKDILNKVIYNEQDIISFFVYLRQILEEQGLKKSYPKILFFSNWLIHNQLSRKNTINTILDSLKNVIIEHYKNRSKLGDKLSALIGLTDLKNEIKCLLKMIKVNESKSSFFCNWRRIEDIILKLLLHKPIQLKPEFEDRLEKDPNIPINPYGFKLIEFEKSICFEIFSHELQAKNSRVVIQMSRM